MHAAEIVEIEHGLGFVFPDELVRRCKLKAGDEFIWTEVPGGVLLTPSCGDAGNAELKQDDEVR